MTDTFTTTVEIQAPPETVFRHFVEPKRLVRWMGDYARLDAVENGVFAVDIAGVLIRGRFAVIEPPRRIEVTWGELGNDTMPPGSTRLVIELVAMPGGTRLTLTHSGLKPLETKKQAVGWPPYLARLIDASEQCEPSDDL